MTDDLLRLFPNLDDYKVTSPREEAYNCVAWAAGKDDGVWWPGPHSYWPRRVPANTSLTAFVAAFNVFGYEQCADGSLEEGFEKVAIYKSSSGKVTHMARQLTTGRWTSKLGRREDIEHASPADLEGCEYGTVVQFMRRAIDLPGA